MKKQLYKLILVVSVLLFSVQVHGQTWTNVSTDVQGDGFDSLLLDGTALDYYYDQATDSLWFRISVASISPANEAAFGVNVMLNILNGGQTFNFWGMQNTQPYHMLLTTWVTGTAPSSYTGTIGISDAAGVLATNYTSLSSNNLSINMDVSMKTIVLGLNRNDFVPDSSFGISSTITVGVQAAVGSNLSWNDDIYFGAATMTINKSTAGIKNPPNDLHTMNVNMNSSKDEMYIDFDTPVKNGVSIIVTDLLGKVVCEVNNLNASSVTIGTGKMSNGVYIVKATSGDNYTITRKIMVE